MPRAERPLTTRRAVLGGAIAAPALAGRQSTPPPADGMILVWIDERTWLKFCETVEALRSLN